MRGFHGAAAPRLCILVACVLLQAPAPRLPAQDAFFRRADANADGLVNITDPIATLGFLFLGSPRTLPCPDAADADDSGVLNITDGIFSLSFLFSGGPAPPPPGHQTCGADPTADPLRCTSFPTCASGAPPTARFTASVLEGLAPLEVIFDASMSSDEDGTILRYAWDFGDGSEGTGIVAAHLYERPGVFRAVLTLTDDSGATATAAAVISITGTRPITLVETSPARGEGGVAVTRETILRFDGPVDAATAVDAVHALFAGASLERILHPSADGKRLTLFYKQPLPASATVRVVVDGDILRDRAGNRVDADGDGQPGGAASIEFATLGLTFVPGTSVCGRVFASDLGSSLNGEPLNVPLAGVTITVDGISSQDLSATTDAMGDFRLEPAPSGRFFVHIRGYTALDVPPGAHYPSVGKAWDAVPGEETKVADVYLPLIQPGTLQPVSDAEETRICFADSVLAELPEWYRDVCLTVPPGALLIDPTFKGEIPAGRVGIAPVDPARLPSPLPDGLDFALVITVQTDGAENFDQPVPICFPNLPDPATGHLIPAGGKTALWSFNHDSGDWEIVGSMTVGADGRTVCTDPGVGIKAPGWHGVSASSTADGGEMSYEDPEPRAPPRAGAKQEGTKDDCDADSACSYGCKVYLQSGEERLDRVDLVVPGRGIDFVLRRTYRSRLDYDGPVGHGWDFDYNDSLYLRPGGDVERLNGRGHLDTWRRKTGGGFTAPAGHFRTLVERPDGTFLLRSPDGFQRHYHADGRLMAHVDRNGNQMVFEYDGRGRLDLVIDPHGREYRFIFETQTDGRDRLARVRDFLGREVVYTYDARGDLVAARTPVVLGTSTGNDFPRGRTERYVYSAGFTAPELNHNLIAVHAPEEVATGSTLATPVLELVYGTDPDDPLTFDHVIAESVGGGRANASGIPAGGTTRFHYQALNTGAPPGNPELPRGKVTITERNGNVYEYFANELGHHIITRRLTRNFRPGEPAFYEVRSYFDDDGQLVRRVFPEGNEVRYAYDTAGSRGAQGNLVAIRNIAGPRGADGAGAPAADIVLTMAYEPLYNQLSAVTDPRGNAPGFTPPVGTASAGRYTTRFYFDYQEGSDPVEAAIEMGIDLGGVDRGLGDLNGDGRTDQSAGRVVRAEQPAVRLLPDSNEARLRGSQLQPIITETWWNDRGQPLAQVDPEGNVTRLEYYPETDPDGDGEEVFSPHLSFASSPGGGYLKSLTADSELSPRRSAASPPAAIRTSYGYDPAGNLTSVEDPRGVVTLIEVNALDEPVMVTRGAAITARSEGQLLTGEAPVEYRSRRFYDHNGRLVRSEVENRDGPPGEPDPHGLGDHVERTFTYDILDRLVEASWEAGSGETLLWQYRYDANELLTRIVRPEGNVLAIEYDERNRIHRLTRGLGTPEAATSSIDYDRNGNRVRLTDAADNDGDGQPEATVWTYDGFDRLVETRDALGNRFQRQYDPASNLVRSLILGHPAGRPANPPVRLAEVHHHHDELNRLFQVDEALFLAAGFVPARPVELADGDGDGRVTSRREFDALGRLTFQIEDDGETTSAVYDGAHRLLEVSDQLGNRMLAEFDQASNPVRSTSVEVSAEGLVPDEEFTTLYVYDQLDRLVRVTDNAGQTTRFAYDSRDNLVARSDAEGAPTADPLRLFPGGINGPGNTAVWHLDGLDRVTAQIRDLRQGGRGGAPLDTSNAANPDGQVVVRYQYDGNSRLAAITDDGGHTTSFEHDALDRLIRRRYADESEHLYAYDRDGNMTRTTDANGSVATRLHDPLNRLTRVSVARGAGVGGTTEETLEYDGLSRLTRHADDNGAPAATQVHEVVYDSLSRVLEERQNGRAVSSAWSGDGKRTRVTYPGGRSIFYTHDAIDRIQTAAAASPVYTSSWIGPDHRELQRVHGNGTALSYLDDNGTADAGYDAVKRIARLRHLPPGGGAAFVDREYGYNREGQRISESRGEDSGFTDEYRYDSLYRIAEARFDEQGPPGAARRDLRRLQYLLDGVGSRRLVTASTAAGDRSDAYAVNEVNEYTAVGGAARVHDANGNLKQVGSRAYTYDYRDRLIEVSEAGRLAARHRYLGDNRRSRKTTFSALVPGQVEKDTLYYHDGLRTCEEAAGAGGQTEATYVHHPVYLDEVVQIERTAAHPLGAGTFYLHQDARANVVAATGAAGTVVERVLYDDFGRPSRAGAAGSPWLFQGQHHDAETGLYYVRNRHYDPAAGRFLQRDPGWDPAHQGGWYTFAGNNPGSRRDPLGLQGEDGSKQSSVANAAKAVGFAESAANLLPGVADARQKAAEKVAASFDRPLGKAGTIFIRRAPVIGGVAGAVRECSESKEKGVKKYAKAVVVGTQRGLTSIATFPEAVICGATDNRTAWSDTFDHLSRTGEWKFDPNSPANLKKAEEEAAAAQAEQDALRAQAEANQADVDAKMHEHNLKRAKERQRERDRKRERDLGTSIDGLAEQAAGGPCPFIDPDPFEKTAAEKEREKSLRKAGARDPEEVRRLQERARQGR